MEKIIYTKDRSGTYKRYKVYTSQDKYLISYDSSVIAKVGTFEDALTLIRSISGGEINEIRDN